MSNPNFLPRLCTLDGFTEELAKLGGVDPSSLEPLSQINVTTERTTYRLTLIDPATATVLRMELHCELGHIVTEPVVSVEIDEEAELPGPY